MATASDTAQAGLFGFGSALAMVISYTHYQSILWAIGAGLLSWAYVIWFSVGADVLEWALHLVSLLLFPHA